MSDDVPEVLDPEPVGVPAQAALTNPTTIVELVAVWERTCQKIRAAFALLVQAEDEINRAYTLGEALYRSISIDATTNRGDQFDDPDSAIKRMTAQVWMVLIERMELRRILSSDRWEKLQRRIEGKDDDQPPMPAITVPSVTAFLQEYRLGIRDMFAEKVEATFSWLRPPQSKYKTNSELEVPHRVILEYMVEYSCGSFRANYHRSQRLAELESLFQALDGQGDVIKGYRSELENAIAASTDGYGETRYFKFRACRKNTLHLTFRRLDLLARLNQYAGGKRLKPHEEESV